MTLVALSPGTYESASGRFLVVLAVDGSGYFVKDRRSGHWIERLFFTLAEVEEALATLDGGQS